ncbi:MAG: pyridoxamine 5'-phosphate oxidase family protein [Gammaproteobacteria bacterium]
MKDSGKYGSYAMSAEELARFCEETEQAVLCTLRKTGSPHGVPLGFWYDGEYFYVTIGKDRAGPARMRNDARVCLTIPSASPYPTRFVIAEGRAEEFDDVDHRVSRMILTRGDPDKWVKRRVDVEKFFKRWVAVGRAVFRIHVDNLITFDGTHTPKGEKYGVGTRMPTDPTPRG